MAPSAGTLSITPLPAWVREVRPHQEQAVIDIMDAFERVDVVFLDAPVGSGKTLIAELVRRELDTRALYVCSDKQLQDQFAGDFDYAKVLKGRANYPTQYGSPSTTAEDCTSTGPDVACMFCDSRQDCGYQIAKAAAIAADLAVVNTSYLLTEANGVGRFSKQPFIVADEADMLEGALLGHVEYVVPQYIAKELRLTFPIKGAHKPTLAAWMRSTANDAKAHLGRNGQAMELKVRKRWNAFVDDTHRVADELDKDIQRGDDGEDGGRWLRIYDTKTFAMAPVIVSSYGPKALWRHGHKWLVMSGTIISAQEMADSLGLAVDFEVVEVPMTFPVENRPIILAPIANMTFKAEDVEFERMARAIERVCDLHEGERILVHTVSYALNKRLNDMLVAAQRAGGLVGRELVTYDNAQGKMPALARYRRGHGSVLLAPSMSRGVDLRDDDCRVVVIAKVPYPSFGDKRVSARIHMPGGQAWYVVQTIRDLVQMAGRGVRSETDHATTYVLDAQFMKNTWRKNKALFPRYWRDAVDVSFNPKQLL
jgi:Rad3-related DNA helicase